MTSRPFRLLGLAADGRPVVLRLVAAEPVPVPPAAGPRRLGAAWLALLDMPCPPAPALVEVEVEAPVELLDDDLDALAAELDARAFDEHLDALAFDEHLDELADWEAARREWARRW